MTSAGPLYPNQPLTEVATEVRFRGDLSVELIQADFQRAIAAEYPFLMVPGAVAGVAPSTQPFRFESDIQHSSGVQLAINSFSYFSKDYPGHERFLDAVRSVAEAFWGRIQIVNATRVGWRYINAIPFTRENGFLPLSRIFQENPYFGTGLLKPFVAISQQIITEGEDCTIAIKLDSMESSGSSDEESLILDIDVYDVIQEENSTDLQAACSMIEHKHDQARQVFESLISDDYRSFLKGGSDE